MKQIKVQPLSQAAFRRYGEFLSLVDNEALRGASIFSASFFADVISMDYGRGNPPSISVCQVTPEEKRIIRFIEYHQYTCEGILPLDGDVILFVGVPVMGELTADRIEAFYVPQGTFVKLHPLIVHGSQFSASDAEVHSLCLLAGRTFKNDMTAKRLPEDEQIELVLA